MGEADNNPRKNGTSTTAKTHISEQPMTLSNWYKHINWLNCTFILFVPLVGCIFAYWTPLRLYTAIFAIVYYFNAGLGITAGPSLPTSSHP
jgi:stearoyl-CoA desaturase (delta-9 desaturase)